MLAADLLAYGKHSSEQSTAAVTAADKHCPAHGFHLKRPSRSRDLPLTRDTGGDGVAAQAASMHNQILKRKNVSSLLHLMPFYIYVCHGQMTQGTLHLSHL